MGLQPDQFRLYDNDKEQNLTSVDVSYTPISLVVAVQANVEADKILPQVNKVGSMLKPIILGDQGEAAVIAYDHAGPPAAAVQLRSRRYHQGY